MKDYTVDTPVWSDSIPIVEENDLVNAENDNAAAMQLLQNALVLWATKVNKEEGKSLVSDIERTEWNAMYQQATGYTDQKIADLINGAPSTLDTLGEIASAMGANKDVVEALNAAIGTKADQKEMESLLGTKLEKTGDSKDNVITFGSSDTTSPSGWTNTALLKSGETHKSFAQKVSTMFKNVRWLYKMLGTTDISAIGGGTVTGAINALNTGLDDISNAREGKGYINACNDNTHHVGITFENYNHNTVPVIVIDGAKYPLVPNNEKKRNRSIITNLYVDFSVSPWKLVVETYIDGTVYACGVSLQDI